MERKTVGLCAIIKDDSELSDLKKLINSCKKYVDKIYVTATNEPCNEIKSFCEDSGVIYSWFKWINDFSKARNFNFAQNKCDFTLWGDCDDVIINAKKLPELVETMEKMGANVVYMNYNYAQAEDDKTGICDHQRPRLMQNDGLWKWEKSVHETLNHPEEAGIFDKEIYYLHSYREENKYDKELRNYKILLAEYNRDGDKTDPRTLHYLAKSSFGLALEVKERDELLEQAIHFYTEHIKQSGWDEESYKSYCGIAYCLSILKRNEQCINALMKATQIRPDWNEAYWLLSRAYLDQNNIYKSIEFAEIAMIKQEPNTALGVNKALRWAGPADLVTSYIMVDKVDRAVKLFNSINNGSEKAKELGKIVQDAWEAYDYVNKTIDLILYTKKYDKRSTHKFVNSLPDFVMNSTKIQEMRIENSESKTWDKKSVVIMCGNSLEDWADPSIIKGIGGSETAVIYMGRELVKRGFDVTVFNRCGKLKGDYRGVKYRPFWEFCPKDKFDWLISWRNPDICKYIQAKQLWLWNHDKVDDFDKSVIEKVDKFIFLSKWQAEQTNVPKEKWFLTSNGVDVDSLPEIGEKDPNKIIYASSPDRGLETVLRRWKDIKKALPKAELYPFYGWENFDKIVTDPERLKWKAEMVELLKQDGIHPFERIGQKQLMKEFATAKVWFYPTAFWEINCITGLQAQMLKTIPVTTDYAALDETVQYGTKIKGVTKVFELPKKVEDKLVQSLIEVMKDNNTPDLNKMSEDIRSKYSWSAICDQWVKEYQC